MIYRIGIFRIGRVTPDLGSRTGAFMVHGDLAVWLFFFTKFSTFLCLMILFTPLQIRELDVESSRPS